MPYFKWTGVDLLGKDHSGVLIARSAQDLEAQLHKQEIGLVRFFTIIPKTWIGSAEKQATIDFFRQLAVLLESGVFLDQALHILANQQEKQFFKEILNDLCADIEHGRSLGHAMMHYHTYFDPVVIQVIISGHESGQFVAALCHLANYYQMINDFYKKLKSALMMPLITLAFFFVIATIIFTVIIPLFASMFLQVQQELPAITKIIITMSHFFGSISGMALIMSMSIICAGLYFALRYTRMRLWIDYILFKIPLMRQIYCAHFFTSLALLAKGGIQLVPSLQLIEKTTSNQFFKTLIHSIYEQQLHALELHAILGKYPQFFPAPILAMIAVGQESNTMPLMLEKIVFVYEQQINKKLAFISLIIQPLVMIILGLLITLLIFSIYLPIFNLSWSIS